MDGNVRDPRELTLSSLAGTLHRMPHPDDVVHAPADRPICEVQPDAGVDEWWPGEVRALFLRDDGWYVNANWTVRHVDTYSRTLPAAQVCKPLDDGRHWADR